MARTGWDSPTAKLSATQYRPDVDGLRAIAVMLVVAHHLKLPFFSGGFVGVDIFFVISGFLIINQIVAHIADDRFSFGGFWARRALRILPPYLIVIVFSVVAAHFILTTDEEFKDFGDQVLSSSLMVANHLFLMQQGYFDAAAELKPLLHFWSLAVEEQFYIVAPIVLVGLSWLWRRPRGGRRMAIGIVVAMGLVSFILCVSFTGVTHDRNYAFFLMPLRIWEFVAGGMIALAAPFAARWPRRLLEGLGLAGFALIGFAMTQFSDRTIFPGTAAAIPVLGACLIILVGMSHSGAWASRLLATPPLVGIGLVSYSWYLWHWPLLTFARIYNFGDSDTTVAVLLGGVLSLILAVGTYCFVEKPIRAWGRRVDGRLNWRLALSGFAGCGVVAMAGPLQAAVTPAVHIAIPKQPEVPGPECALRHAPDAQSCTEAAQGKPIGVIIGDSHATSAHPTLSNFAEKHGLFLANSAFNGCSPLFGVGLPKKANDARCAPWHETAAARIEEIRPRFAIFAAQWLFHVRENAPMWERRKRENQRAFFIQSLRQTIATLNASGVKRILIIAPIPLWRESAPRCVAHGLKHGSDPAKRCGWSYSKVLRDRAKAMQWLEEAIAGLSTVRLVDPIEALCTAQWCRPYAGSTLLYTDHSHLSSEGVNRLIPEIEADMRWVMDIPELVASQP